MENAVALILATVVLILIPGPNVALIVANSLRHGLRGGLLTALGTTAGIAAQLALVVAGMAAMIEAAAPTLFLIKWLGVAYLAFLAVRAWCEPADDLAVAPASASRRLLWRGFALAVVNPKTLLFNAAFLPQFIEPGPAASTQLCIVTGIFLFVVVIGDALWAVFAASLRGYLAKFGRLRHKLSGGFLLGAAVGLAMTRRSI